MPIVTAHHSWSERTLSLSLLLKNKMLLNMTCNDILLALVSGALKGHHPTLPNDVPMAAEGNNFSLARDLHFLTR